MEQKPEEVKEIKEENSEENDIFSLTIFNGRLYSSGPGQDDKRPLFQWPWSGK